MTTSTCFCQGLILAQLISRKRRSHAAVCTGYKAVQLYVSYIQPSFKLLECGETSAEVAGSCAKPGRTRRGGAVSPH